MKILRLFAIILVLMNSTMLLGQGYEMKIHDVKALAGEVIDVQLEITNEGDFVAFGLDIPLPDGFEYVPGSFQLNPERKDGHIHLTPPADNNILRIFAFNQEETKAFRGNKGVIATFQLTTPEKPGSYELVIDEGVLSRADATEILPLNTVHGDVTLMGNEISIHDAEVIINQNVTIDIDINNYQEFTAFQVDLLLPEGFSYIKDSWKLNTDRTTDHLVDFVQEDNSPILKLYVYSLTNSLIKPDLGNIISFDLKAAPEEGGDFLLDAELAIISDKDGEDILTKFNSGTVTVFDHNIISFKDLKALTNQTVSLEIEIDNSLYFTGFELVFELPEEVKLIEGSENLTDRKTESHRIDLTKVDDNKYKIIVYSLSNENFTGWDGAVATIDVELPNDPGVFDLVIHEAIIANIEEQDILTQIVNGILTVEVEVVLALNDTDACVGQFTAIDLSLANSQEAVGFETEIHIPEGFTYVGYEFNRDRATDHILNVAAYDEATGVLRIQVYSMTNAEFVGMDGTILTLHFEAPVVTESTDFEFTLDKAIVSNIASVDIITGTEDATITLRPEPAVLFAFNDVTAVTGSSFVYNYNEEVTITLEEVLLGEEPFTIAYVLNDDEEVVVEDLKEGDVLFGPDVLPAGEHTLKLTMVMDANGCIVADPEDIYHLTITVNAEPAVLFAFNDVIAETGSAFVYCFDEEVTVTLSEILLGTGPIELTYVLNDDDPVTVEGLEAGDVLFGPSVLPVGEHTLKLTSLVDANGSPASNPEEVYNLTITVNPEPVLAFDFNGILAVTDSEFEFNANEEVVVTLVTVHAGEAPFHIVYELNGVEAIVEGLDEGDELFKGRLPYGDHELVVTSIIDANGCAVVTPEEFYKATINVVLTEVETLAELRAMPSGMSYIYVGDAVIVAMDGFRNRKFIQDETAAIMIDDQPGTITTEYDLYDVVTNVAGTISIFRNLVQFQPLMNTAEAAENTPVEPVVFLMDEVTSDDQAKLVRLENVSFVDLDDGEVFANGTNYTITDGENTFVLRTDFWNVDYIGEEIPHVGLNISGVIIQFFETLQLVPRFAADIEIAEVLFEVTFNVDLGPAIEYENLLGFDPETHKIFITGSLLGWAEPGTNDEQIMTKTGDDPIVYSKTFQLAAGEYAYKYFSDLIGAGWNGGEWPGGDDRIVTVANDTIVNDMFAYRDEETSVPELEVTTLKLYPNPASSSLTIESSTQIIEIRMVDMVGRMVYSARVQDNSYTMDVNSYKNGIYFVQVITANGFTTERVQITK